ncbi:MAG: DUF1552 domain-containing protein [Myxococcaceae bacterium]
MSVRIPRRMFLQGAGVAIGLPLLEAMTPFGRAFAQTAEPRKAMIFHFGNGLHMRDFTPWGGAQVATNTPLPMDESVSPLIGRFFQNGVGQDINVVTGLANGNGENDQHALRSLLTSVSDGMGTSVDQVIARYNRPVASTMNSLFIAPFNGFELAATMMCFAGGGDTSAVQPYTNPGALFTRLFGSATGDDSEKRRKTSILDYVADSIEFVKGRASASDLTLLDQHLSTIRDLERRINAVAPTCNQPGSVGSVSPGTTAAERQAWIGLMTDLAVLALQCDLTRVVSICLTATGVDGIVWAPGYEHHQVSHYDINGGTTLTYQWQDPGAINRAQTASNFQIARMAETLAKIKNRLAAGGQSLLNSTAFVGLSEFSAADLHSRRYLPIVTAGLGMSAGNVISYPCYLAHIGGQTPPPGTQLDNPNWVSHGMPRNCAEYGGTNIPLANLWLTLIRAMGINASQVATHGDATGTLGHLWPAA